MMGDAQYENGSTMKVPEAVGLSSANVFANKYTPSPSQSYSVLVMVTTLLLSPTVQPLEPYSIGREEEKRGWVRSSGCNFFGTIAAEEH